MAVGLAAAILVLLGAVGSATASRVNRGLNAQPPSLFPITLTAGSYRFWTTHSGSTTDTVLHLLAPVDKREVTGGWSDDYSGVDSQFTVTLAAGNYVLLVRDYWGRTTGTSASIFYQPAAGGATTTVASGIQIAGALVSAPDPTAASQTVLVPGGATDTMLGAIDCVGHLIDWNDDGGMTGSVGGTFYGPSFIRPPVGGNLCRAIVYSYNAARSGTATLVFNDTTNDHDGDGLGASLESELGTCDSTTGTTGGPAPLACSSIFNLQDTDRDGLRDGDELFGVNQQFLSAWGANPAHKDMFLEIDWAPTSFTALTTPYPPMITQYPEAEVQYLQNRLAGPAGSLLNPDGLPGISVHADMGAACANPSLCGNWGAGGRTTASVPATIYPLGSSRTGLFRNGVAISNGSGPNGSPSWGITFQPAAFKDSNNFVHELGHSFGLQHYGGGISGGSSPCKPNYPSIMNYAVGGKLPAIPEFSRGIIPGSLDPANVRESPGLPGGYSAAYLGSPAQFGTLFSVDPANDVDWNRDGDFTSGVVRAGVGMALVNAGFRNGPGQCYGGWGVNLLDSIYQWSSNGDFNLPAVANPELVQFRGRLYSFVVNADAIWYWSVSQRGPTDAAGCDLPGGGTFNGAHCATTYDCASGSTCTSGQCIQHCHGWPTIPIQFVPRNGTPRSVAVMVWKNNLHLAYMNTRGGIYITMGTVDGPPSWEDFFGTEYQVLPEGNAVSYSEVALAPMWNAGADPTIAVWYVGGSGGGICTRSPGTHIYKEKKNISDVGPWNVVVPVNDGGFQFGGYATAGLAQIAPDVNIDTTSWPTVAPAGSQSWINCAVLADERRLARIACADGGAKGLWHDRTAEFFGSCVDGCGLSCGVGLPACASGSTCYTGTCMTTRPSIFAERANLAWHRGRTGGTGGQLPLAFAGIPQFSIVDSDSTCHGVQWFESGSFNALTGRMTPLVVAPGPDLLDATYNVTVGSASSRVCSGMRLYEDSSMPTLQANGLTRLQFAFPSTTLVSGMALESFPFVDHSYHDNLSDFDDFKLIEIGLCQGLKAADGAAALAFCGTTNLFGLNAQDNK